MKVCPICGEGYDEFPALSRRDNHTEICPRCGVIEAVDIFLESSKSVEAEVYTAYSHEADITFIMEDKGKTTKVVGFYYGEPDEELTRQYYGSLVAEFE